MSEILIHILILLIGVIAGLFIAGLIYCNQDSIAEIWRGYMQARGYTDLPDTIPDPDPDCVDDDFGGKR